MIVTYLPFLEVLKDVSGGNKKIKNQDYQFEGLIPIIDQGKTLVGGYTDNPEYKFNKAKLPVIVFGDHTKNFKYIDQPFAMGADGIKILKPTSDKYYEKYLYHYLRQVRLTSGGYDRHYKYLIRISIPIPSLSEQKRIAAILDKAEALRDKRKKSIAKLDELLQSVFFDMFGDPVTNPKGWDFDSLAKSTKKISDGTHHSPPIVDSGIPYITAKHLRKEGLRFYDDPWYISVDDHLKIYSRCDPIKGDVLYIKDGATTGLAAINRYDFQFSMLSSLALLRPKETLLTPEYLCYWLNNDRVKVSITEQMGGAAIRRLTLTKIKKLRLPIPPLFLQKQFSDIVNEVNKIKEVHMESLKNLETIFFSIQQRAFAGEL